MGIIFSVARPVRVVVVVVVVATARAIVIGIIVSVASSRLLVAAARGANRRCVIIIPVGRLATFPARIVAGAVAVVPTIGIAAISMFAAVSRARILVAAAISIITTVAY
jgi:hypothetical protein